MATDDQTAGVQRFWVWAPGMLATTQDGRRKVRITEHTLGVGHEMVPDLSDAATVAAIARTAQAEVERLQAELAQARADARVLVGMVNHACLWGLTQEDHDALEPLVRAADGLLDDEAAGVVRRALGGAA